MSDTLEQAIAAIKAGDKNTGGQLLNQVLQTDPRNETAWLWMTAVVGSDEERRKILEHVLSINPDNEIAQNSLAKLKPPVSPATDIQVDPYPTPPQQFETPLQPAHKAEENEAVRKCPYCAETIKAEAIVCRFCGRDLRNAQSLPMTVSVAQVTGSISPLLDQRIRELASSGWQIVFRAPTEAQLKKPKQWNSRDVVLFTICFTLFSLAGGVIGAVFIIILALIDYAVRGEKTVYYTEEQLRKEQERMRTKKLSFFR